MTVSRRGFLKTSGALIVTFSMTPESMFAQRLDGASSNQLDAWLSINSDGTVTAYTGKCELGHGLYTAQTQLIAEELSVAFNRVKLIQCDTALTPDQGTTSGAQSHPTNFNQGALALAGATAREALFQMAATRFAVPADQLTARDGVIALKSDSSKKVTLCRTRRREEIQSHPQQSSQTEKPRGVDSPRDAGAAHRNSGDGDR